MEQLLSKLSTYNIFNYLFPGILFTIEAEYFFNIEISQGDIIKDIALYYFLGLLISRIGSLIVEPVLKKIKVVKFSEYKDFLSAKETDSDLVILSEVNNMYRTLAAVQLSVLLMILASYFDTSKMAMDLSWLGIIILLVMFIFAYRKQCKYINKRVSKAKEKKPSSKV